jgi:hypothetical protein
LIVCGDEHVSPWITRVIQDCCTVSGHVIHTVDDYQAKGLKDEIWVRKFAKAGGEAILSADEMMVRRHAELVAICDAGLRLVLLPPKWSNSVRSLQASHILFWWPRIEEVLATSRPRSVYKVPWGFAEKPIERVKFDYEAQRKKLKQERKNALKRAG